MECGVDGQPHKTPHLHPRHWHPPHGMTLPRRDRVRLNRLRTGVGHFRSCLCKWGMASYSCGLWVWRKRTNRRPCCPPMSNPSISPWTAWPDGSGRWDNWMAAQHLPIDLVRPSSGFNNSLKRKRSMDAKFLNLTFPVFEKKLRRPMTSHSIFQQSLQYHELSRMWRDKVYRRTRFPTPRQVWSKKFIAVGWINCTNKCLTGLVVLTRRNSILTCLGMPSTNAGIWETMEKVVGNPSMKKQRLDLIVLRLTLLLNGNKHIRE